MRTHPTLLVSLPLLVLAGTALAGVDPRGDGPSWIWADAEGDGAWASLVLADTNGDGLQDVVIADPIVDATRRELDDPTRLLVFLGGAALPAAPDLRLDAHSDVATSSSGAWGDVDGDGDDDFVTWSEGAVAGDRTVWVRWGGAGGPGAAIALDIQDSYSPTGFAKKLPVGRIADVNGDGFGDVLMKQTGGPSRSGQSVFSLHLGTATGVERVPAWKKAFDYRGLVDAEATIAGDLDADGFLELVMTFVFDTDLGRVSEIHVYRGNSAGLSDANWSAQALPGIVSKPSDVTALAAGDLDLDGRDDVLVALSPNTPGEPSRLLSFHGDPDYAFRLSDPVVEWRDNNASDARLIGVGDLDGDDVIDIAIASPGLPDPLGLASSTGGVAVGLGRDVWFSRRRFLSFTATGDDRLFGALGGFGDTDGDGLADLVIVSRGVLGAQVATVQRFLGFADRDLDHADDAVDCAPEDARVFPDAEEVWYDGTDQDCDGNDDDRDLDGVPSPEDCDDLDPARYVGAAEVWYDGVDQDCDGNDADQDNDGATAIEAGGDDCADRDPLVGPGMAEVVGNGVDDDCAGGDSPSILPAPDCGCTTGGAPGAGAAALLLVALIRRRARPSPA